MESNNKIAQILQRDVPGFQHIYAFKVSFGGMGHDNAKCDLGIAAVIHHDQANNRQRYK